MRIAPLRTRLGATLALAREPAGGRTSPAGAGAAVDEAKAAGAADINKAARAD